MPQKFTDKEYAERLPKKQVGTAVLFFNTDNELLIVKPDYKDCWLVPGGATDEDESPLHCAVREVNEEIALNIPELKLVGIYYGSAHGFYSDSLKFIFYGGILTNDQIKHIKIQKNEITDCKFIKIEEALPLLSDSLQKSIPQSLIALKNNTVVYIENSI